MSPHPKSTWSELRDIAVAGESNTFARSTVGAVMQQIGKAVGALVCVADKRTALKKALPHLEESVRIARGGAHGH